MSKKLTGGPARGDVVKAAIFAFALVAAAASLFSVIKHGIEHNEAEKAQEKAVVSAALAKSHAPDAISQPSGQGASVQNTPAVQNVSDGGSAEQINRPIQNGIIANVSFDSPSGVKNEAVSTDDQSTTAPHLHDAANPEADVNWVKIPIPKHYSVFVEGLTGPAPPDPRLRAECLMLFGGRAPWSQNCTGTDVLVGSTTSEDVPIKYKFTPE